MIMKQNKDDGYNIYINPELDGKQDDLDNRISVLASKIQRHQDVMDRMRLRINKMVQEGSEHILPHLEGRLNQDLYESLKRHNSPDIRLVLENASFSALPGRYFSFDLVAFSQAEKIGSIELRVNLNYQLEVLYSAPDTFFKVDGKGVVYADRRTIIDCAVDRLVEEHPEIVMHTHKHRRADKINRLM